MGACVWVFDGGGAAPRFPILNTLPTPNPFPSSTHTAPVSNNSSDTEAMFKTADVEKCSLVTSFQKKWARTERTFARDHTKTVFIKVYLFTRTETCWIEQQACQQISLNQR